MFSLLKSSYYELPSSTLYFAHQDRETPLIILTLNQSKFIQYMTKQNAVDLTYICPATLPVVANKRTILYLCISVAPTEINQTIFGRQNSEQPYSFQKKKSLSVFSSLYFFFFLQLVLWYVQSCVSWNLVFFKKEHETSNPF